MRFALWCAWSNGGLSEHPDALSVRGPVGRPDWFNADCAPDWKPGPFYGARLCLGCADARAWAVRKAQELVRQHRLDYLKHDIGPIVTHCNKTTHRHRHGVDASYWAAMGTRVTTRRRAGRVSSKPARRTRSPRMPVPGSSEARLRPLTCSDTERFVASSNPESPRLAIFSHRATSMEHNSTRTHRLANHGEQPRLFDANRLLNMRHCGSSQTGDRID